VTINGLISISSNQAEQLHQIKVQLIRQFYQHGFDRQQIIDLFHFVDWVMRLPQEMERQLWQEIGQLEEEKKMPYISSVQRIGERQGEQSVLLRLLHRRFATLPSWVEPRVLNASLDLLREWTDRILDARSLEEIFGDEAQAAH
ncbi:MAG: hypothetical protein HQL58_12895, partial [Magnetococcales bacterium]|nr:hypothetical protein [Magnetococcales bacterium]